MLEPSETKEASSALPWKSWRKRPLKPGGSVMQQVSSPMEQARALASVVRHPGWMSRVGPTGAVESISRELIQQRSEAVTAYEAKVAALAGRSS
jgi:hypothetical protein